MSPKKEFKDIVELSNYLRSPQGCPWDREQTIDTLKKYIVEETYEVVQAIEDRDDRELIEELGDLLLQVVLVSQIASEENRFDITDVIDRLHNKLVRRHPHVFGENKAKNAEEAVKSWHSQKLKEKDRKRQLLGIPRSMPSLLRAQRIGEKASQVGFDWKEIDGVLDKVREEIDELGNELKKRNKELVEKEYGDMIFSLVNLARHLDIDAESSTQTAIEKFISRFNMVEDQVNKDGKSFSDYSLQELDRIWNEVK